MPPCEELCLSFPVRETTVLNIFQVYKWFQHTWARLREPQTCLSLSPESLWFYFMSPCCFSVGPFVLSGCLICILYYQANMSKCFCITKDSFFYSFPRKGCAKTVILSHGDTLTVSIGVVSSPQAKNSRKITTTAWYTLGSPIPCRCKTEQSKKPFSSLVLHFRELTQLSRI